MKYSLNDFKGDLFGGITTAIVAIPVSLAFGVAAGLGPLPGLYGAIAVGFFASVFGGTRSQISGPTGPMAIAMSIIVTLHASTLAEAFTVVIMAGLVQILLGALRLGRFVAFTPYSVISGFMSGIGIIIILVQSLPLLGAATASGGTLGALRAWPAALQSFNVQSCILGLATLAIAATWPRQLRKYMPPALAALAGGTLLSVLWLPQTPVIGEVPTGLPSLQLPDLSAQALVKAVQPAITLGLLGSIDSLLTSLIADSMTRTRHNPNRELIGQGIGNAVVGLLGGLPGAGATPGTVVNIRAGGRTQLSGVIRSLFLLALVLGFGQELRVIPHAVLAGILIKVGWDIIDWRFLLRLPYLQREHLAVMVITLGLTVFLDLVTAVAVGLIAAGMAGARSLERLELDSVVSVPLLDSELWPPASPGAAADMFSARAGLLALRGNFTVASSTNLIEMIGEDVRQHEAIILDFTETSYFDDSAARVMDQLIESASDAGKQFIVAGLSGGPEATLSGLGALRRVPEKHLVGSLEEAKDIVRELFQDGR